MVKTETVSYYGKAYNVLYVDIGTKNHDGNVYEVFSDHVFLGICGKMSASKWFHRNVNGMMVPGWASRKDAARGLLSFMYGKGR